MTILPKINSRGCYKLSSPFDSVIDPNKLYTCTAIRTIQEMVYSDDHPYETIYEPNGLSESLYNQHIQDSVLIVTLSGDDGENIYVPANYIEQYPFINGVVYKSRAIVINIGSLPSNEDLTVLMSNLASEVTNTIGINTTPEEIITSSEFIVPYDKDVQLRSIRNSRIASRLSYKTKYTEALQQISALTTQNSLLECVLRNNCCGKDCSGTGSITAPETEHVEVCQSNVGRDTISARKLFQYSACWKRYRRNDVPTRGTAPTYQPPTVVEYEFYAGKHLYVGTADLQYRNNV